ncbi:unnamed protein product [Auanema sp. JU1783]|nr:unnamed protein product [Auanema sp. JU1783]
MFQRQRRQQRENVGVYLLAMQLLSAGPIPPITLGAILLQIAVFLGYVPFLDSDKTKSLCLLPTKIIQNGEWYRLIFPVIMHGSDMHLYYNMISLLYKGKKLEKKLGSSTFACILCVFTIASTCMTVAVSSLLDTFVGTEFSRQCAVGFSG